MKNRSATLLILITCIFAAFTLGFLAGRATAPGDTIVVRQPEPTTEPTQAVLAVIPDRTAVVPAETTESATEASATAPAPSESGLININTATLAQLDTLPGIGPVIAQRIIDYREAHGPFTTYGQLLNVEGIGEMRLSGILDLITIE